MDVYTGQMGKWRKVKALGLPYLDTTFKTGSPLAPSKEIVYGYKYNGLSEEDYTKAYLSSLEERYNEDPEWWWDLMCCDTVVFMCFCGPGKFCHRLLLVEFLKTKCKESGIDFNYAGEIE